MEKIIRGINVYPLVFILLVMNCGSPIRKKVDMYIRQENWTKVREILEQENKIHKNNGEILLLLGEMYGELGDYKKLDSVLKEKTLKDQPYNKKGEFLREKYWRKNFNKGLESFNEKRFQTAARNLENAVIIDPGRPEPHRLLGEIYAKLESYDKAKQAYEIHLKLDEKDWFSCNNVAELCFHAHDYEETIRYSNLALERNPQYQIAQIRIAQCKVKLNRVDEALAAFEQAKTMGESLNLLDAYGKYCLENKRYELAKVQFTRALALSNANVQFNKYLAESCYGLGDFYGVAAHYKVYLSQNPEDLDALKILLIAYDRMGDRENFKQIKNKINEMKSKLE